MSDEENEAEEYYGILPPEREYPPFFPELAACLNKAPKMIEECEKLQNTLDRALVIVQTAARQQERG